MSKTQACAYYLGVVATANKSSAALAREDGSIAAVLMDAPPLSMVVNRHIREDLAATLARLAQRANMPAYDLPKNLKGVCIAASGVYADSHRFALRKLLDQIGLVGTFTPVLCEDANSHLAANFLCAGGVVIASTGANVLIQDGSTQEPLRVDGWGSDIGDDGSGYDLGRRCMRAFFKAKDGRFPESKILSKLLLEYTGTSTSDSIIDWFYRSRLTVRWRSDLANLTEPLVIAAEHYLDPLAYRLVSDGANDLFYTFETANRHILEDEGELAEQRRCRLKTLQPVPLILEGGIFENSQIYRRRFLNGIHSLDPSFIRWRPTAPLYRPVVGALALGIAGTPLLPDPQPPILKALRRSAEEQDLLVKSHPLEEISNAWTDVNRRAEGSARKGT